MTGALPFNITISNPALKAGEFELIFLRSHPPESFHSGFPFLPFCMLEIVPDLKDDGKFIFIAKIVEAGGIDLLQRCRRRVD
jgi:hypothetical protein